VSGAADPYASFSPAGYSVSRWVVRLWARIWLRARAVGKQRCPAEGPVLIVANHASFLDPPMVGSFCPRVVHFMARDTLTRIPLMGPWMRRMGVVLLPRNATPKDSMRRVLQGLGQGRVVGIFAEGTRSTDGTVGPFQGGIEFLVKRSGATVLPCGLRGTGRALPKKALFARPYRCETHWGEPMTTEQILALGGVDALRREIARLADLPLREDVAANASDQDETRPPSRLAPRPADGVDPGPGDGPPADNPQVQRTSADSGSS